MGEIKWIKLSVDMFDNRKIKYLRRLPDGDTVVLIWVMLLTMAGRCNAGGMVFLTENVQYTPKILADELGVDQNTIMLAIQQFRDLGMITASDCDLEIANWEEYQNVEGMELVREQTRKRVAAHRDRKRLAAESTGNVTSNVTVTQCNATDIDIDRDLDIEIDKDKETDKPISKGECVNSSTLSGSKTASPPKEKTPLQIALGEWRTHLEGKGRSLTPQSTVELFRIATNYALRYGDQNVIDIIKLSIANDYGSIVFDRLDKMKPVNPDKKPEPDDSKALLNMLQAMNEADP